MLTQVQKEKVNKEIFDAMKVMDTDYQRLMYLQQLSGTSMFSGKVGADILYNHATEDIRTYTKYVGNCDSVLLVTGSGEQILNSIVMGAKKIDSFDTNPLAKRAAELKIAAVRGLSKQDYLTYFKKFSVKLFDKFSDQLNEEARAFWGSLYNLTSGDVINNELFRTKELDSNLISNINMYLDDDMYSKLQKSLDSVDIRYFDASLYDMDSKLSDESYDFINLSNIYEYLVYGVLVDNEHVEAFYNYVMDKLYKRLKNNGKMLLCYMYAFNEAVKNFVEEGYKKDPKCIVRSGAISFDEIPNYSRGYTSQNLAYCLLLNRMKNQNITCLETEHVEYGQSFDMSHDMALILNK